MFHGLIGRREVGKTTMALYLARQSDAPRMILDQRNDIAARGIGARKVYAADDLIDAYAALVQGSCQEIVYAPLDGTIDGFTTFSVLVHHYVSSYKSRRLVVLLDEAGIVERELQNLDHPMQLAFRFCRRSRVHFFLTCHQPKNLPTNTRAIADYLVFFQCTQEHDLGVIAERCSAAFADRVSRLAPFHCMVWDDKTGREIPVTALPSQWKIDLGAPAPDPAPAAPRALIVDLGPAW